MQVFISYSRKDLSFVEQLADDLKNVGFEVWYDISGIRGGTRWRVEIENALKNSQAAIVVLSPDSIASEWVEREFLYASNLRRKIIPLYYRQCDLPLNYVNLNYVDMQGDNYRKNFNALLRALNHPLQDELPKKDEAKGYAAAQTDLDMLASQAIRQELQGDFWNALQTYYKIKRIDPLFPRVDIKIAELEREMRPHGGVAFPESVGASTYWKRIASTVVVLMLVAALSIWGTNKALNSSPPLGTVTSTDEDIGVPLTSKESPTPIAGTQGAIATATEVAPMIVSEITDDRGAAMIIVPAGEFSMGNNRFNPEPDELPVHTVYLDSYYIDKFEVTNQLYNACVEEGKCVPPRQTYLFAGSPNEIYYDNPQYNNYPVIYVDWNMAKAYCEWRDSRLPTEAEWEKAARATNGNTYPWGNDLDCQKANYQKCLDRPSEVGSYPDGVSPYGAYDMAGNVEEWVADWYSDTYYSKSPRNNPLGPITGQARVVRGGSWTRFYIASFSRREYASDYNTFDIGFRCARSTSP